MRILALGYNLNKIRFIRQIFHLDSNPKYNKFFLKCQHTIWTIAYLETIIFQKSIFPLKSYLLWQQLWRGKSIGLGVRRLGSESRLCHSLAMWHWKSHLASLGLHFFQLYNGHNWPNRTVEIEITDGKVLCKL